ncbi:non-ribosomal peptide synthetase [Actinokineospora enzanensis]|uniref:non-ribosomal peptide synthetase n=1 Tax=Actinokineospora enzanensis TaxID=155975 RepID=UPI00037D921B|nr:non-ribosomal peptide synthetase [Actinokineospora enzanensis]
MSVPHDVLARFRHRAAHHPDACAIRCAGTGLSYAELDRRAGVIGGWLRARGCAPEQPVAVLMDRGIAAVAAVVGVVAGGCAYVPLDPRSPLSRIALILGACRISLVLVDTTERADLVRRECGPAVEVVVVGELSGPAHHASVLPEQLVYVIHTSGSTGVPKGVAVSHGDLVAFTEDPCWDGLADRVLHYSPLAFDASAFEIWVPLSRGGCVVVAPPGELDAGLIGRVLVEESVTCAFITTSLFNVMVEEYPESFSRIRQVWMGGEAASPAAVGRALRHCAPGTVVNVYGPTEATIFASFYVVPAEVPTPVPIGSAMDRVRTYVLDDEFHPVPEGELCLGGTGVARGYVGRPGLTADRFAPDPFAGGGARMYRTGDVVRSRPDGLLEFVGRRDDQVKLRGFRIEPGEIEARLRDRPDVADARVLARPDAHGDRSLVAYVVARRGTRVEPVSWPGELLDHLRDRVPAYMVPSACVVLDELPLNANGKLDPRALPDPDRVIGGRGPRSAGEELLCGLFAEVLGLPEVGADDDFFALGGHSLLATRVVARVEPMFGVRPEVRALFEAPTPARLAQRLSAEQAAPVRPPLTARPRTGPQPLAAAQRRLWLVNRMDGADTPDYHMPLLFQVPADVDVEALALALRDTVTRHESLRTVFPVDLGEPRQVVLTEWELPLPDRTCGPAGFDAEVTRFARVPFDLERELPLRAILLRNGEQTALLIVVHHIAADGWSLTPLTRDIGHAYQARTTGTCPTFPPLPVSYLDYSAWQHDLLAAPGVTASQLEYWADRLDGAPVESTLPVDRPRPEVASHAGALVEFTVPTELQARLVSLARETGTTLFMVLQAGLAAILTRLGGGSDIVIGSPVAGRSEEALDDLVGFFVNTIALRTDTSGDPAFRVLLDRVRASCLAAYANQDVPFDLVVERVNPARGLSRHPLFQVVLGLLNTPDAVLTLDGRPGEWRLADAGAAKFDLAATLVTREDGTLDGTVEYATDLFHRDTVLRYVDAWLALLDDACTDPEQHIGDLVVPAVPVIPVQPTVDHGVPAPKGTGRTAGSAAERVLCGVFAEVLDTDRVGVDEDFFELGGHSLLAIRLVGRLKAEHGVDLGLRDVFRTPTVAGLLAGLSRDAVSRLTGMDVVAAVGIPVTTDPARQASLSYAQRRLWFLDQLWPGRCDYNVPLARRLTGPLDVDALTAAVTGLVHRHDILRTRYEPGHDEPSQVVDPPVPPPTLLIDYSALPADQALRRADRMLADEATRPFDLACSAPFRIVLIRIGVQDHLLALLLHHIATDGWSNDLLWRELSVLYNEHRFEVTESALPPIPLRYGDYAAWQHTQQHRDDLVYWRNRLVDLPPVELPTDHRRPQQWTGRGAQIDFEIPGPLRDKALALAKRCGATQFTTLLTGFQLLVAKYTGQRDVAVGTSMAGRDRPELEPLAGLFVNTLVLRADLDPRRGFAELLAGVTADAAAAYSHAGLPFEQLVGELRHHRDLGRNPLFQLMFDLSYPDDSTAAARWDGLVVGAHPVPFMGAKVDLELVLVDRGDVVAGSAFYATDLFDQSTVDRLLRRYLALLETVLDHPDTPVGRLGFDDEEGLGAWNDTAVEFDLDHGLHELVACQTDHAPDEIAVVHGHRQLTYQELDELANRMAHHLIARGLRPREPVGFMLDRSIELPVALLGILKAGGMFMPLDPDLPPARVDRLMDRSGARLCLTDLDLDDLAGFPGTAPDVRVHPDDLVSLYYTSGSTGEPKAVANTHRGWANRMWWMQHEHHLIAGEGVLHKTVLSFDDSAVELFWPWLVGGTVVMLDPDVHRDPRAILRALVAHRVAVVQFVPSVLALFLEELDGESVAALAALRHVISSGEALPPALVGRFHELLGRHGCLLHNQWGPTEVSIDATLHTCRAEDAARDTVPIGLPIANSQVHVLDDEQRPLPQGVEGELHIGGVGLARGYWNDPRRTAEAFVPDPFGRGRRLYRTGDRGVRTADGSLSFRGRTDFQLKIRGVRIEPAEIECALTEHDTVRDAVVRKWEPATGAQVLAGYVVPAADRRPDPDELRKHLAERLAPYLVPSEIMVIDELPRTASGKLDRNRLPAPRRRAVAAAGRAPRTDSELLVADVWSEFLPVDGIDADFFASGGHSLLASRIISRLRRVLGIDLSLLLVFENPTIAALATAVERAVADEAGERR